MDLSTDAPLDDAGSMASAALALTTDGEVIFSGAWGDLSPRLTPRRPALSVSPLPPRPTRPRLRPAPRAARDRIPHARAAPSPLLSGAWQEARALSPALCAGPLLSAAARPGPAYYYSRAPANPEADSPPGPIAHRWCHRRKDALVHCLARAQKQRRTPIRAVLCAMMHWLRCRLRDRATSAGSAVVLGDWRMEDC